MQMKVKLRDSKRLKAKKKNELGDRGGRIRKSRLNCSSKFQNLSRSAGKNKSEL